MKNIIKYLLPVMSLLSYLAIPNNSSSNNSLFSKNNSYQTNQIIDSLNQANKQNQLEKIAKFEEARENAEKITKFNSKKEPLYLTNQELNQYIDKLYAKGIAPKEISKELFKKIIRAESGKNIYAYHPKSKARGLGQLLEIAWNDVDTITPYTDGVYDPEKNLEVSLKYLRKIKNSLKKINPNFNSLSEEEKAQQIASSYNWGIGSFKGVDFDINRLPKETRSYLKKLELI